MLFGSRHRDGFHEVDDGIGIHHEQRETVTHARTCNESELFIYLFCLHSRASQRATRSTEYAHPSDDQLNKVNMNIK